MADEEATTGTDTPTETPDEPVAALPAAPDPAREVLAGAARPVAAHGLVLLRRES